MGCNINNKIMGGMILISWPIHNIVIVTMFNDYVEQQQQQYQCRWSHWWDD